MLAVEESHAVAPLKCHTCQIVLEPYWLDQTDAISKELSFAIVQWEVKGQMMDSRGKESLQSRMDPVLEECTRIALHRFESTLCSLVADLKSLVLFEGHQKQAAPV